LNNRLQKVIMTSLILALREYLVKGTLIREFAPKDSDKTINIAIDRLYNVVFQTDMYHEKFITMLTLPALYDVRYLKPTYHKTIMHYHGQRRV
jgi:hypothetical protein